MNSQIYLLDNFIDKLKYEFDSHAFSNYKTLLNFIHKNQIINLNVDISIKNIKDLLPVIEAHTFDKYKNKAGINDLKSVLKKYYFFLLENSTSIAPEEDISAETPVLIDARKGQGKFRKQLMDDYGGKCVITGFKTKELLTASHIKPWKHCITKHEKLDRNNGLLLSSNIDKLFDAFLISFDESSTIMISNKINKEDIKKLGITKTTKINVNDKTKKYLNYHMELYLSKNSK
jgi:predicted restriction endonuclease